MLWKQVQDCVQRYYTVYQTGSLYEEKLLFGTFSGYKLGQISFVRFTPSFSIENQIAKLFIGNFREPMFSGLGNSDFNRTTGGENLSLTIPTVFNVHTYKENNLVVDLFEAFQEKHHN